MDWQSINIIIALLASTVCLSVAGLAWVRPQVNGAQTFMFMMLGAAIMTFFYALELTAHNAQQMVIWSKFQYIGSVSVPVFWLLFAWEFCGYEHLIRRSSLVLLAIIPLITLGLAWTNEWHGLIWADPRMELSQGFPVFAPSYGIWFWIYLTFSYVVFLGGSVLLWRMAWRTRHLYRSQSIATFVGTAVPWLGNIFAILNFNPIPALETSPISFAIGGSVLAYSIFRLKMLDIMPIAYSTVIDNMPDAILVLDMEDRILLLNKSLKNILHDPKAHVIGKVAAEVFAQHMQDYVQFKGVTETKTVLHFPDRDLELRIMPLQDQRQKQQGRIIIVSDITQQQQAERVRQEQETFNRALQEAANTLNRTLDPHVVMQHILEAVLSVVPHDFSNIMLLDEGSSLARIHYQRNYPPAMGEDIKTKWLDATTTPNLQHIIQTGESFIIDDTLTYAGWINKHITHLIRSTVSAPIRLNNEIIGFINLDSSQPKSFTALHAKRLQAFADQAAIALKNARLYQQTHHQAEVLDQRVEELTLIQRVYREINEVLDIEPLLMLTMDTAIRLSNAESGILALMEDEQLKIVKRYGDYVKFELDEVITPGAGIVGRVLQTLKPELILDVYDDPDYIPVLPLTQAQMVIPLLSQQRLIGLINLETQENEKFTANGFSLLQILASRIGAALDNARLRQSLQAQLAEQQKLYAKVSQLSQLKSDMIRIAAHDLGNPLGVVRGFLELMEMDIKLLTPEHQEYLKAMNQSTTRMDQIIKDILSLERIERMAQADTATLFDLHSEVENVVLEYLPRMQAKAQQHQLEINSSEDFGVIGDSIQLYEAITNLMSNAVKYTPAGGKITVTLERSSGTIYFRITDTGFGIPAEQQDRLFQPFYRATMPETRQIDGTGLGLHLVKNIVERHGGSLIFHSSYGQGSTFGFSLPASPVPLPQPAL